MATAFPSFGQSGQRYPSNLDLAPVTSQTRIMAHSYIKLDFGTDEEKAQQARHKLDGWKQAFRLDKRLLYKLDRPEGAAGEAGSKPEPIEKPAPAAKSKGKTAASPKAKTAAKTSEPAAEKSASAANGKVGCWSGSIFLRTRSFPSSAGSIASPRRSLSRALRRRSSITAIPNSNRRTGNSRLLSDLTEAREFWICEFEAKLAAKFRAFGLARNANLE